MKIAILGATGHIAKNIICGLHDEHELHVYARSGSKLQAFLQEQSIHNARIQAWEQLDDEQYDVIINCIGIGNPGGLHNHEYEVLMLTESFDNRILDYLQHRNPACLYINFSSGAAYVNDFSEPAAADSQAHIAINNIKPADYYGISKVYTEAKHRSLTRLRIVDLRVFGFFSRFIDLSAKFFLCDVVKALQMNEILLTDKHNIIRDYIYPGDLLQMLRVLLASSSPLNVALDCYSRQPVSKFELLDAFSQRYGLQYRIHEAHKASQTGSKPHYYSLHLAAGRLGFVPQQDALTGVMLEYEQLIKNTR